MAVYTKLTPEQVSAFLEHYALGALKSLEGIEQGVSNSNVHLHTEKGHYILTLFEPHRVELPRVPFFLSYASYLSEQGIPAARAIADRDGALYRTLAGRPAAIMEFLEGQNSAPAALTPAICYEAGKMNARMHLAGASFPQAMQNEYGIKRWDTWVRQMGEELNDIGFGLCDALRGEIMELDACWPDDLPSGAIHADMFPDNVFFRDGKISGVIDYHFACTDMFAYDLAIVINAWCFDGEARFVREWHDSLLEGYQEKRPLSSTEKRDLPILLRGAALRFVLSRCEELLAYQEGDFIKPHSPYDFMKRLEHFQDRYVFEG